MTDQPEHQPHKTKSRPKTTKRELKRRIEELKQENDDQRLKILDHEVDVEDLQSTVKEYKKALENQAWHILNLEVEMYGPGDAPYQAIFWNPYGPYSQAHTPALPQGNNKTAMQPRQPISASRSYPAVEQSQLASFELQDNSVERGQLAEFDPLNYTAEQGQLEDWESPEPSSEQGIRTFFGLPPNFDEPVQQGGFGTIHKRSRLVLSDDANRSTKKPRIESQEAEVCKDHVASNCRTGFCMYKHLEGAELELAQAELRKHEANDLS